MRITNIPKDVRDLNRLRQVINVLFKYELGFFIDKIKLKHILPLKHRLDSKCFIEKKTQPEVFRKVMEELGGSFIKLGQLLSIRPDLIPHEYCEEFRKLQDSAHPLPYNEIKNIVSLELGRPVQDIFKSFQEKPIASASIAQVHKAILKNNKIVAVKVQRPNLKKTFDADIDILTQLAFMANKHLKPKILNPIEIVEEFKRYSEEELDFIREAKNADRFNRNFKGKIDIVIPKVFWDYTTEKVLTLEFIDGKKISEIEKEKLGSDNRKIITENILSAIFKQIFEDGFFHADPHPGNILILKGNKIAFLDFGIVGYFDEESKDNITKLFIATILGDIKGFCDSLIELGFAQGYIDEGKLKEDIAFELSKYYETTIKEINFQDIAKKMIFVARKNKIKMPSNLVLLFKSVITVEGIAKDLDPEFNFVEFGKPFVKNLIKERHSPAKLFKNVLLTTNSIKEFISTVPKQANELLKRIKQGDEAIQSIHNDVEMMTMEIDKSSNRIAYGLLIAAFLISSALIINFKQIEFFGFPLFSMIGFGISIFLVLILFFSIIKEKKYF